MIIKYIYKSKKIIKKNKIKSKKRKNNFKNINIRKQIFIIMIKWDLLKSKLIYI